MSNIEGIQLNNFKRRENSSLLLCNSTQENSLVLILFTDLFVFSYTFIIVAIFFFFSKKAFKENKY